MLLYTCFWGFKISISSNLWRLPSSVNGNYLTINIYQLINFMDNQQKANHIINITNTSVKIFESLTYNRDSFCLVAGWSLAPDNGGWIDQLEPAVAFVVSASAKDQICHGGVQASALAVGGVDLVD